MRRVAVIAAAIQMPVSFTFGLVAGQIVGWGVRASILLGAIFAISSSIVMIKVLLDRGEATSPQARYGIGLMIIQDLSVVLILALMPVIDGSGGNIVAEVALSLFEAGVDLIGTKELDESRRLLAPDASPAGRPAPAPRPGRDGR